jgi:hypothetical protein
VAVIKIKFFFNLIVVTGLLFLLICISISCTQQETRNENKDFGVIAKAGNERLTADDFNSDYITTGTIKDSAYNAKKVIETWAIESLFYQEARSKLTAEETQVEKQVEEYKKSLVNFIYQSKIVEANLDTVINNDEIEEYYENHRDNFILRDNIVKVNYLKVPSKAPGLVKIKKLIWSASAKDKEQLIGLCSQNAENFFMNDSTWLFLDDIKKEIPALKEFPDYNIVPGRVLEFNDEDYYYYLKVKDVKVKNGLSPINFEKQNIRKFILNNRKTQIISQYKQILLEKARANKTFVTY